LQGLISAVPIILGYFPIGFAFGVLASAARLSISESTMMSIFVYAGSAQLISVGLIERGAGPVTLAMTVFLINLRHLLMSAYLAPYLGKLKRWQQILFCYGLTDETFAVHSTYFRLRGTPHPAHLIALNSASHLAWIGSTFLGAWISDRLPADIEVFGLDYALPAMFIALLVLQLENGSRVLVSLFAAALSVFFFLAGFGHWHIILATLVASGAGFLAETRQSRVENNRAL